MICRTVGSETVGWCFMKSHHYTMPSQHASCCGRWHDCWMMSMKGCTDMAADHDACAMLNIVSWQGCIPSLDGSPHDHRTPNCACAVVQVLPRTRERKCLRTIDAFLTCGIHALSVCLLCSAITAAVDTKTHVIHTTAALPDLQLLVFMYC